ncbi:11932_t:CDS:2, partial [Dentiscutata heterogama]
KKCEEIISTRKLGKSYRQIVKLVGRPPILNESAQDRLTQLVLSNRRMTKEQIQAALK